MKKLMIVAAVAMASFGLRAATADWSVSVGEYAADWSTPTGSILIEGLTTDPVNIAFVDGFASDTIAGVAGDTAFDVTMSVVLDDGKTWSMKQSFTTPTFQGEGAPADQDALSGLNDEIALAFQTEDYTLPSAAQAAEAGWSVVPEPTSGLLLLIGVAGLALRRRRA